MALLVLILCCLVSIVASLQLWKTLPAWVIELQKNKETTRVVVQSNPAIPKDVRQPQGTAILTLQDKVNIRAQISTYPVTQETLPGWQEYNWMVGNKNFLGRTFGTAQLCFYTGSEPKHQRDCPILKKPGEFLSMLRIGRASFHDMKNILPVMPCQVQSDSMDTYDEKNPIWIKQHWSAKGMIETRGGLLQPTVMSYNKGILPRNPTSHVLSTTLPQEPRLFVRCGDELFPYMLLGKYSERQDITDGSCGSLIRDKKQGLNDNYLHDIMSTKTWPERIADVSCSQLNYMASNMRLVYGSSESHPTWDASRRRYSVHVGKKVEDFKSMNYIAPSSLSQADAVKKLKNVIKKANDNEQAKQGAPRQRSQVKTPGQANPKAISVPKPYVPGNEGAGVPNFHSRNNKVQNGIYVPGQDDARQMNADDYYDEGYFVARYEEANERIQRLVQRMYGQNANW